MNILLAAGTAAAMAIGATPTALATTSQIGATGSTQPAGPTPVSAGELVYPEQALRRHLEGDCTVRFLVHADGHVSDVQARTCSALMFKAEAERYARTLRYSPRADANPFVHQITIQWRGEEPQNRRESRQLNETG